MVESFGLMLVQSGLIDREALYEALRRQRDEGGLLGTRLLALGKLRRGDLLQALARHLKIPPAPPSRVIHPDPAVAGIFDAATLRRLHALPFARDAEGIRIAFSDHRLLPELRALPPPFADEPLRLYVAVEPDVVEGLEALFGLAPEPAADPEPPTDPERTEAAPPRPPRVVGAEDHRFRDEAEVAFAQATGFDRERTAVFRLDALAAEERRRRRAAAGPKTVEDDALPAPPDAPRLAQTADDLFEAPNEGVLARRLVAFYASYFPRVLLLARHGEVLRGVLSHGLGLSGPEVALLRIPTQAFARCFEEGLGYYGAPPGGRDLEPLWAAIRDPAVNALIVPVETRQPPAWLVYADHGGGVGRYDEVHDLEMIAKEAATALDILRER